MSQEKSHSAEEALKEKYADYRMAAAQSGQLQQRIETLEEKKQELQQAMDNLDSLRQAGKKSAMLSPLAEGIFVKATLEETGDVLMNVGSNVVVKKSAEQAKGLLGAKLGEMVSYQRELVEELSKVSEKAERLEQELEQMAKEE